jgi:TonB family protein
MSTRFSLLLSLGLHGILAIFLLLPVLKMPEKSKFTVDVQWENGEKAETTVKKDPSPTHSHSSFATSPTRGEVNFKSSPLVKKAHIKPSPLVEEGTPKSRVRGDLISKTPSGTHKEHAEVTSKKSYQPLPKYPWICRKRGQEGNVSLLVQTNADGRVIQASLHKSSGYSSLDQVALETIKTWIFPESSLQKILSFTFRLKGHEGEVS